jgi:hypothetical protein
MGTQNGDGHPDLNYLCSYGVTFSVGGVAFQDVKPGHRKARSLILVEA